MCANCTCKSRTCGICKWWKLSNPKPDTPSDPTPEFGVGYCKSPLFESDGGWGFPKPNGALIGQSDNYGRAYIKTGQDFGCINWEPVTE